jgi:hypothetical protein
MEDSDWLSDVNEALKSHSGLRIDSFGNDRRILGRIEVWNHSTNVFIDDYEVAILCPIQYPKAFPLVWETGGKIPRIADRHVHPDTGNLCLAVPPEEALICMNGITTVKFFDGVLLPRLADEYRVRNGHKYSKEYSHGVGGRWEFYMRTLKVGGPREVLSALSALLRKQLPRPLDTCPCKSGRTFRDCHKSAFDYVGKLGNLNEGYYVLLTKEFEKVHRTRKDIRI